MADYIVSGAGDPNINGLYTLSGQSGGKDYFTFAAGVGGPYYISWAGAGAWIISVVIGSMPGNWQFIFSAVPQPPLVGWSVGGGGTPPAGTLAVAPPAAGAVLDRTAAAVLNRTSAAVLERV